MQGAKSLRIGLPYGKHIRHEVYRYLKAAGIDIPSYLIVEKTRNYSFSYSLGTDVTFNFVVDNPRDLIYRLAENLCDVIITGSDYVHDWSHFKAAQSHLPAQWEKLEIIEDKVLDAITRCQGRLCFLLHEDRLVNTLDDYLIQTKLPLCFSEFPYLASRSIEKNSVYQKKYKTRLPQLLATFFSTRGTLGIQFPIIYSHGLTEAKAATNPNIIIYDIVCTGETAKSNHLKIIQQEEMLIHVSLFSSALKDEWSETRGRAYDIFLELLDTVSPEKIA